MGSEGGHESAKAGPAQVVAPAPALNPSAPFKAQPIHEAPALSNLSPDRRERRQALRQTSERLGAEGASNPGAAPSTPVAAVPAPPEHQVQSALQGPESAEATHGAGALDGAPFMASPLPQSVSMDTRQVSGSQRSVGGTGHSQGARGPRGSNPLGAHLPSLDGQGPPRRVMEAWPLEQVEEARQFGGGGGGGESPTGGSASGSTGEASPDGSEDKEGEETAGSGDGSTSKGGDGGADGGSEGSSDEDKD